MCILPVLYHRKNKTGLSDCFCLIRCVETQIFSLCTLPRLVKILSSLAGMLEKGVANATVETKGGAVK